MLRIKTCDMESFKYNRGRERKNNMFSNNRFIPILVYDQDRAKYVSKTAVEQDAGSQTL